MPTTTAHQSSEQQAVHPRLRLLNTMIYALSVSAPLMAIPQVLEVWFRRQAAGVSMTY